MNKGTESALTLAFMAKAASAAAQTLTRVAQDVSATSRHDIAMVLAALAQAEQERAKILLEGSNTIINQ